MDYTKNEAIIQRLVEEWKAYGKIIIDYDFDNTIFDYHGKGVPHRDRVVSAIRAAKSLGAYCYCFTSSDDNRLKTIENHLKDEDIPCDGVNTDHRVVTFGGKKPYFNLLLDDRAGLGQALECLEKAIEKIRVYRHNEQPINQKSFDI